MEGLFLQILVLAEGLGVLKLGDVSLDGTKIMANASKHHAMSWGYAEQLEQQLRAEVQTLLARATAGDGAEDERVDLPEELQRREDRLTKIAEVKAEISRRAAIRDADEQAAYEANLAERAAKEVARGRKLGVNHRRRRSQDPGRRIRSISRMGSRGSCRSPAGALLKLTTPRRP